MKEFAIFPNLDSLVNSNNKRGFLLILALLSRARLIFCWLTLAHKTENILRINLAECSFITFQPFSFLSLSFKKLSFQEKMRGKFYLMALFATFNSFAKLAKTFRFTASREGEGETLSRWNGPFRWLMWTHLPPRWASFDNPPSRSRNSHVAPDVVVPAGK
jgi:hypothetical protein